MRPAAAVRASLLHLAQAAKDAGVEIMMETRGEKLIVDENNAVVGVEATQSNGDKVIINAAAVILATWRL